MQNIISWRHFTQFFFTIHLHTIFNLSPITILLLILPLSQLLFHSLPMKITLTLFNKWLIIILQIITLFSLLILFYVSSTGILYIFPFNSLTCTWLWLFLSQLGNHVDETKTHPLLWFSPFKISIFYCSHREYCCSSKVNPAKSLKILCLLKIEFKFES